MTYLLSLTKVFGSNGQVETDGASETRMEFGAMGVGCCVGVCGFCPGELFDCQRWFSVRAISEFFHDPGQPIYRDRFGDRGGWWFWDFGDLANGTSRGCCFVFRNHRVGVRGASFPVADGQGNCSSVCRRGSSFAHAIVDSF